MVLPGEVEFAVFGSWDAVAEEFQHGWWWQQPRFLEACEDGCEERENVVVRMLCVCGECVVKSGCRL